MIDVVQYIAPHVCDRLRAEIEQVDGNEVFFIATVDADQYVIDVTVHARGHQEAVNAFADRAGSGSVLIHNHPSGRLEPSNADLEIAAQAGAIGAGFYIVDNGVNYVYPVVLPWKPEGFRPVQLDNVTDVFVAGGRLASALPGFEPREAQLELAGNIAATLSEGSIGVFEAGTGIGKSFAYLVPALQLARDNSCIVVVSTGSLALQSQIVDKDVPALERALDERIDVQVLKGRSNYVSLRRAKEALGAAKTLFPDLGPQSLDTLKAWLVDTPDGDRAGLGEHIDADVWEAVQSESDNCLRARCPHFNECHYFNSRRRAAAAQIVVVNHALLAADLAVRHEAKIGFSETVLLPPYQHVVLDEAHAFEAYARNQFGGRSSELAISRTIGQLVRQRKKGGALHRLRLRLADRAAELPRALHQRVLSEIEATTAQLSGLRQNTAFWFSRLSDWHDDAASGSTIRTPVQQPAFEQVVESGVGLATEIETVAGRIRAILADDIDELSPDLYGNWQEVVSRALRLERHAAIIRAVLTNRSPKEVSWIERTGRRRRLGLQIAPVDVGGLLQDIFWRRQRATVLTSATLANGPNDFSLLQRGLGLEADLPRTAQLASPFPYPELVTVHTVNDLPANGGRQYQDWIDAVLQLVIAGAGRALVLCTSYGAVRAIGKALQRDPRTRRWRTFVQGEAAPAQISAQFRDDVGSVLVGTSTFWEGFDASGETLRHVILTKLPFSVPTHPLEQARHDWVKENGGDPFMDLSLPEAVTRFRQGFGRLVRRNDDWGAVTILDPRIQSKGYGKRFLRVLPEGVAVTDATLVQTVDRLQSWFAARETVPPAT